MTAKQVWKFQLTPRNDMVSMPAGAQLLHVAMQGNSACVWALVDPQEPVVRRQVATIPTGIAVYVDGPYVGTFHTSGLVFHVFDGGEHGLQPVDDGEFAQHPRVSPEPGASS